LLRAGASILFVLGGALVSGVWLARRITTPIAALRDATRRMAHGEYPSESLAIRTGDEIEGLAQDFEAMASQIQRAETRYRAITELTSDFAYAYAVAPDGGLTPEWVTDAFARITGFSIE